MSALLQLHLHSQLNTGLQWIGQRQLQDGTRNFYVWWLGASYIRELTLYQNIFIKKYIYGSRTGDEDVVSIYFNPYVHTRGSLAPPIAWSSAGTDRIRAQKHPWLAIERLIFIPYTAWCADISHNQYITKSFDMKFYHVHQDINHI